MINMQSNLIIIIKRKRNKKTQEKLEMHEEKEIKMV